MLLRIESKVLVHKGVLGGCRKEVLLLVVAVLGFVSGNVGKGFEVVGRGGRDRGAGDDIGRGIGDIEKREVLDVVKGRPDELWQWGARRGSDGRGGMVGIGIWTGVIPGVEV